VNENGRDAFAFNGETVAPVIRAPPGDVLKITYINDLPSKSPETCAINPCMDMTNLHFHGLSVSPDAPHAPKERQFWRIVNASADRYLDLQLDGQTFEIVALDGMPLAYRDPKHPSRITYWSRPRDDLKRSSPAHLLTRMQPCLRFA
jgi:FtsP/CotA-like multicopper oxidase with cupredoxin domain